MTDPRIVPGWDCSEGDHDWTRVDDRSGDPEVINGTADCSFMRCRQCEEVKPL